MSTDPMEDPQVVAVLSALQENLSSLEAQLNTQRNLRKEAESKLNEQTNEIKTLIPLVDENAVLKDQVALLKEGIKKTSNNNTATSKLKEELESVNAKNIDLQTQIDRLSARWKRDERRVQAEAAAREDELRKQLEQNSKAAASHAADDAANHFATVQKELESKHKKESQALNDKLRNATRKRAQAQSQLASVQALLDQATKR